LVEQFRNDPACKVFLSTDAGGVGLNLQAASVVVNFEPAWNPARLRQRIGRVYRLGQSRPAASNSHRQDAKDSRLDPYISEHFFF
jgi:SNF2 family DNA or RNA helicase